MRRVLTWVLVLIVIAGAVGAVVWLRQTRSAQPVGDVLRTGQVVRGDLQLSVPASGSLSVNERTELLIPAPGRIVSVHVEQNARVESGEVLARIDTSVMERTIQQAEIALAQAQLALDTARETTDEEEVRLAEIALNSAAQALEVARIGRETARIDSEALLVQAQREREAAFSRYRDAIGGDQESRLRTAHEDAEAQERIAHINARVMTEQAESQYQAALTRYRQSQRNLERQQDGPNQDELRQREIQVEQAELRLAQAQRVLQDSTLTAPFAGIVAGRYVEAGTYQRAGSRAFSLIDDSEYAVEVVIDEIDIGVISVGQQGDLVLDAYPRMPLGGTVERIAPAPTNLGGLVAYQVRLKVEPTGNARLLDGMTASVSIRTELVEDVLLIPNWAVRIDQQAAEAYTYRMVAGQPVRTPLVLGQRNDSYSEVLSGLAEGDQFALVAEQRVLFGSGGGFFGN
jgi:HlyD family secretion protein